MKRLFKWLVLTLVMAVLTGSISCAQENTGAGAAVYPQTEEATPLERAHSIDIAEYRLVVDGLVENPLSLRFNDLLEYPAVTQNLWLLCPGVFEQFNDWTGIPVAIILQEAGLRPEAAKVSFSSGGYSRSMSIEEAQKDGVFLAYQCDGRELSEGDGYPVRLVARDQIGEVWVKFLTHIEVR